MRDSQKQLESCKVISVLAPKDTRLGLMLTLQNIIWLPTPP